MSTEFEQVADVEWEMNLQEFYFNITDNMTAVFDFTRTNLAVLGYSNTTEQVNFITLKTLLPIVNAVIKTELNKPFTVRAVQRPVFHNEERHHVHVLQFKQRSFVCRPALIRFVIVACGVRESQNIIE